MRKLGSRALIFLSAIVAVLSIWALVYPPRSDPKGIEYVLWKAGIHPMNLDLAADTMIGDPRRNEMVVGKSRAQLQRKSGYLLTPDEASPYLRGCCQGSSWKDRDVSFIRKSPWMVVFMGNKATELVLIKGR